MSTAVLERTSRPHPGPAATDTVEVRPVRSHEEHLVQHVFDGIGHRSELTPFRTRSSRLSPTVRRALTASVPGEQATLVVLLQGRAVGLGHWLRDESDPGTAHLAVAVADAAQERGLGRRLVHRLAAAADAQGVDWFRCPAGVDEVRVLAWLVAMGARRHDRGFLVHVRTVLDRTRP